MRRTFMAGAAAAVLVTSIAAGGATPAAARTHHLAVDAFQSDFSSPDLIDASKAAITTVGVDGIVLKPNGAGITRTSRGARANLHRANHDGLSAELLISNYSDQIGDFSEPLAHKLLGNAKHIDAVADALVADVQDEGWDGISLDLESLRPRDADGLSALARALHDRLPKRASLSICIMSATHPHQYYAEWGYHLATLAKLVDRVELMTYDEHGPWEKRPGPIGALAWQRRSVAAARHYVPKMKLDLGVAGYGYAWGQAKQQLTVAQARAEAGDRAQWDKTIGEWHATMPDGAELWWSDVRSYRLRVALANELGLHGLAMWSLGSGDKLP